jgi:hypothetical protein
MNRMRTRLSSLFGLLTLVALGSFLAGSAIAQEKKVEHIPAGPHEVSVELNHSTVVHVEGNHLVARLENGTLEAVQVPEDFRFHIDSQTLSVHQLKPGMIITERVTSTTKPMIIRTVEIKNGTIWFANPPHITIRDANNKMHEYTVPEWAKVIVNGEETSVFDLRKDMKINTTIMTEEPVTYVERETKTVVRHPAEEAKAEPVPTPRPEPRQPVTRPAPPPTAPEPAVNELPETASPLPLIGLIGLLSLAASFGLRLFRKSF